MTEPGDRKNGEGAGPDEDRTRLTPAPGNPPQPAPPRGDDATAPPQPLPGPAAGDDERTQLSTPPRAPGTPPPRVADDDATRLGGASVPPPRSEADEPTRFASSAPPPQSEPPQSPAADSAGQPQPPGAEPSDGATRIASDAPPLPPAADPLATEAAGASSAAQRSGRATVALGTLINNNYEVKEVLKAGGMGEVYRGENVYTGDPVAIKVVLPELAEDEKVGLMFMREARTLSQLADEAIVRYYNFVKDPAIDRYCLIMEFIRGVPLSDHTAQKGPIPPEQGMTLMRRLAKGLEKAHAREVIHRDLSPDNVMLPDDAVSEAVIIDFGIAKSNVVKEGTVAGQFAGKFKYVSPEQLGHFGGDIGPATDIYGLALLIAAAVIGKPIDMGSSIVEAVQRRQSIPDLSAVPELMRPLIAHMLEPDPRHRPANMGAVIRMIDNPDQIPAQYWDGRPPPPPQATTGTPRSLRPAPVAVPGFQAPPTGSQPPYSSPPRSLPPTSLAPQSVPPLSQPPSQSTQTGSLPPLGEEGRRGGVGRFLLWSFLLLLALGGGAGWYAWREGLLPPEINAMIAGLVGEPGTPGQTPDQTPGQSPGQSPGTPTDPSQIPRANTREGFLATFDTGACTYASRVAEGPNAGMIEGYATAPGSFGALPDAYAAQFGARPSILDREVTPEQCAALEFARALQGTSEIAVEMVLDADTVESGQAVSGRITDRLGRPVWLVLVSPRGAIYNLTSRLSESVGDRRAFRFGLNLTGSEASPQLLMAVATPVPLANAAAARDGANAADLLPLVLDEILKDGGEGVAAVSYLLLTPPAPEPEPEPAQSPVPGQSPGQAPPEDDGRDGGSNGTEGTAPGTP